MARSSRRAGFTLFEVLAAVAILGILYTVLASVAIDGLRAEGDAERRLHASLLADRTLAEIEEGLALESPPPLGSNETEQDEYTIEIETLPFDLATPLRALAPPIEGGGPRTFELLAAPARGGPPPLLEIAVRVRWIEGADEQVVRRTTFGFDTAAVAPQLESLAGEVAAEDARSLQREAEDGSDDGRVDEKELLPR